MWEVLQTLTKPLFGFDVSVLDRLDLTEKLPFAEKPGFADFEPAICRVRCVPLILAYWLLFPSRSRLPDLHPVAGRIGSLAVRWLPQFVPIRGR